MEKAGVVSDKRKNVQPLSEILYINLNSIKILLCKIQKPNQFYGIFIISKTSFMNLWFA